MRTPYHFLHSALSQPARPDRAETADMPSGARAAVVTLAIIIGLIVVGVLAGV